MVFGPAQVGFVFPKIKTKYLKRRDFRVFSFFLTSRTDALFSPASSFRGCDFEKGAPHSNSSRYLPTVFRRRSEFDSDPGSAPIRFRRRSGFGAAQGSPKLVRCALGMRGLSDLPRLTCLRRSTTFVSRSLPPITCLTLTSLLVLTRASVCKFVPMISSTGSASPACVEEL